MFSVVILGVGFIMIAAIFPVAIKMNGQSTDATQGAIVAQQAAQSIASQATDAVFPPTYQYDSTISAVANPQYVSNQYPPYLAVGEALPTLDPALGFQSNVDALGSTNPAGRSDSRDLAAATWSAVRSSLLPATDRRMGCAVAYARAGPPASFSTGNPGSRLVKLVIVTAQVRGDRSSFNDQDGLVVSGRQYLQATDGIPFQRDTKIPFGPTSTYSSLDAGVNASGAGALFAGGVSSAATTVGSTPATLQFKRQMAYVTPATNPGEPDTIQIAPSATDGTGDISAAAEGTFIILARPDPQVSGSYPAKAKFAGTVFRLGRQIQTVANTGVSGALTFELVGGRDVAALNLSTNDLQALCGPIVAGNLNTSSGFEVLFLGRGLLDPTHPFNANSNPYTGPAMDVSVYTTTIGLSK
jgi:hypothetical protein